MVPPRKLKLKVILGPFIPRDLSDPTTEDEKVEKAPYSKEEVFSRHSFEKKNENGARVGQKAGTAKRGGEGERRRAGIGGN